MGNHERFQDRLAASHDVTWMVARWLWQRGNIIEMRPNTVAGTHAEAMEHVDDGDLLVINPNREPREKLLYEVKGSGKDFTCAEDYPFPMVRVCNKPSFDRHAARGMVPSFYMIVNKARTHVAAIPVGSTYLHWRGAVQNDPHYPGRTEQVLDCPKELVRFMPMD